MKRFRSGFTLTEILVVVSIIGILASVIYANFGQGSAQSRDAKRQADLRLLQNAVEQYKQRYGEYPAGCNTGGNGPNGTSWSRQSDGGTYACAGDYIVGLAPEFISVLPRDPRIGTVGAGEGKGYVYITNSNRTAYKIMVERTVESETVTYDHEFSRCDISPVNQTSNDVLADGICVRHREGFTSSGVIRNPATVSNLACSPNNIPSSYAVYGGFAPLQAVGSGADAVNPILPNPFPTTGTNIALRNIMDSVRDTASVWCQ